MEGISGGPGFGNRHTFSALTLGLIDDSGW